MEKYRKKLINISNLDSYEATKRESLKLIPNNKSDFENYIFKKIKDDINQFNVKISEFYSRNIIF